MLEKYLSAINTTTCKLPGSKTRRMVWVRIPQVKNRSRACSQAKIIWLDGVAVEKRSQILNGFSMERCSQILDGFAGEKSSQILDVFSMEKSSQILDGFAVEKTLTNIEWVCCGNILLFNIYRIGHGFLLAWKSLWPLGSDVPSAGAGTFPPPGLHQAENQWFRGSSPPPSMSRGLWIQLWFPLD